MRYPILLVSDPHFTANPRDEYRWGLWPWLRAQCKENGVRTIVWCGDLSDAKDFHPSALVNRLAFEVKETSALARQYFIPGNHEWLKRGEEFWRFLSHVAENVHYMTQPCDDPCYHKDGPVVRFLPFTKTPAADWAEMHTFEDYDLVFMHQTVRGARSSNGEEMEGEDVPLEKLLTAGYVFSGDIHVPQSFAKNGEYVGSPYHVHFGDSFKPRCILLPQRSKGTWLDLHFPTISRLTLDCRNLDELSDDLFGGKLKAGDQVKIRMRLLPSEKHEWRAIRRLALADAKKAGVEVHGTELIVVGANGKPISREITIARSSSSDPSGDIMRYVMAEELGPDALDAGLEVLEK
jgi:DNA repair exonuclease SbcCD nuclease subunit